MQLTLGQTIVDQLLLEQSGGITVLMPGGFKPPHAGHLNLAQKYAVNPGVERVIILVGPTMRDSITQSQSLKIWKLLLQKASNIEVRASSVDNPLTAAFEFVQQADPGVYALASSNKGDDYARVKAFVHKHKPSGPYYRRGIKVVELPIDVSPLLYKNRRDELDNKPISASTLRKDLQLGHYRNIISNYPNVDPTALNKIVQILGVKKAKLHEGGAAGHMYHPFEDFDLTFDQAADMIKTALQGKLDLAQEKLDGQNLMISYRGGKVVAARNKGHIKNFGANALSLPQVAKTFEGRGPIQVAFTEAVRDLQSAIDKLTTSQKSSFFGNGKRWLNLEVLYPDTTNVVPYGATQLRLHNITSYDQAGEQTQVDSSAIDQLEGALKQVEAENQKTFQIRKTNPIQLKQSLDYQAQLSKLIESLKQVQAKFKLTGNDKLATYITSWWTDLITQKAQEVGFTLTDTLRQTLVDRWGLGLKSTNKKHILNQISNSQFAQWFLDIDQNLQPRLQKQAIRPLESIFLNLGVYVLKNIATLTALNPNQSGREIKNQLRTTITQIKQLKSSDPENAKKAMLFLKSELERLKDLGGFRSIVPVEGIVFKYNNKLYKLTGAFAPINKILGYLRF